MRSSRDRLILTQGWGFIEGGGVFKLLIAFRSKF